VRIGHTREFGDADDRATGARIDEVLRARLRAAPGCRRKQQGFALVLHAPDENGAGRIASGAGRERPTHAPAEREEHLLLATDLDGGDTARAGARTDAPKGPRSTPRCVAIDVRARPIGGPGGRGRPRRSPPRTAALRACSRRARARSTRPARLQAVRAPRRLTRAPAR
jgi:hypothetical protein